MKKVEVTNQNNFKVDAPFERCVDFMVRMMEKYGHEMEQNRDI